MRIVVGRGDWRPIRRIDGLRRYAFIGDSTAYGAGVAPDQTLPAYAERQMNELLPGWPVEAVNFGIPGYNIWESWFGFKAAPQVYDGVILVLCSNDADMFDRSFRIAYPDYAQQRWESNHPFGAAVARCFDEIAAFSRTSAVPVAICYYNGWRAAGQIRIGEIIGDLCAERGFPFVDSLTHYEDRSIPMPDRFVSEVDRHPSAIAHEAIGRHLAATLRRQGWFGRYETSEIGAAPSRIIATAQAMAETDGYPLDVAILWGLRALSAKSRVARRMVVTPDGDFGFNAAAEAASEALHRAKRQWQTAGRARAYVAELASDQPGVTARLRRAEDARLTLDELGFALATDDRERLTACLLDVAPSGPADLQTLLAERQAFFDSCQASLLDVRAELDALRDHAPPAALPAFPGDLSLPANLNVISRLVDTAVAQCAALSVTFTEVERAFNLARAESSASHMAHMGHLIGSAMHHAQSTLGFIREWPDVIRALGIETDAEFTTVEVTIQTGPLPDVPVGILTGKVAYDTPLRLPLINGRYYRTDGSREVVVLRFPTFYAGRISFWSNTPMSGNFAQVEHTVLKVEAYNDKDRRVIVEGAALRQNRGSPTETPLIRLV